MIDEALYTALGLERAILVGQVERLVGARRHAGHGEPEIALREAFSRAGVDWRPLCGDLTRIGGADSRVAARA